jgi:hypothetical protein
MTTSAVIPVAGKEFSIRTHMRSWVLQSAKYDSSLKGCKMAKVRFHLFPGT